LTSHTVNRRCSWHSRPRWQRSWWRCMCAFAPHAWPWNNCCVTLERKVAVYLIFPNHCWVSFYRSLHLVIHKNHNTPFPLLQRANTLLLAFWPYSRQDECRTVQAALDFVVLPLWMTC
jgi:hypothetical protein